MNPGTFRCGNCINFATHSGNVGNCKAADRMRAEINDNLPPCLVPGVRTIFVCSDDKPTHCFEYRNRNKGKP